MQREDESSLVPRTRARGIRVAHESLPTEAAALSAADSAGPRLRRQHGPPACSAAAAGRCRGCPHGIRLSESDSGSTARVRAGSPPSARCTDRVSEQWAQVAQLSAESVVRW